MPKDEPKDRTTAPPAPETYDVVARAETEHGELVLRRRHEVDAPAGSPAVLELRVNGVFVMDTLESTSEVLLARAALAEVASPRSVLVGGLGLGFTAHEVLADHRVAHVTVAELEEPLVRWFRDGTIPHGPSYLADGRLTVTVGDVRQVVAEAGDATWDLVLLDVDNGPEFLVHDSNSELYEPSFLGEVRRVLREGGRAAIWSADRSDRLEQTMATVFGDVHRLPIEVVLQGRDETYWLYLS